MAVYGNKEILIKLDELPEINGESIEYIYRVAFDTSGVERVSPPKDEREYYYECVPYFRLQGHPTIRTRKLPEKLQKIFDEPQYAKYQNTETGKIREVGVKVTSISYRTRCSGNGSFIDESITLRGASMTRSNQSDWILIRRNDKDITSKELTGITEKILAETINIKAKVKELEEHEWKYYDCTTLRRVDNWWYPSPVCSGWRRSHKMPYVTLDNRKSLRVLNEELRCHVFLIKPDEYEEGREYKCVDFHWNHREEPEKYCFIKSWAHFKEDNPNGMISYRIDKIRKSDEYSGMVAECTVIGQEIKKYSKAVISLEHLYTVARIVNTEDLNN